MIFVIGGKKYDTSKMEKIADVKKWYPVNSFFMKSIHGDAIGRYYDCELWKSQKGNWLLTREVDYKHCGEAINQFEAKERLMLYNLQKYEEIFGELEEA